MNKEEKNDQIIAESIMQMMGLAHEEDAVISDFVDIDWNAEGLIERINIPVIMTGAHNPSIRNDIEFTRTGSKIRLNRRQ